MLENVAITTFIRHKKYANFTSEDNSLRSKDCSKFLASKIENLTIGSVNIAEKLYLISFFPTCVSSSVRNPVDQIKRL